MDRQRYVHGIRDTLSALLLYLVEYYANSPWEMPVSGDEGCLNPCLSIQVRYLKDRDICRGRDFEDTTHVL